MRRSLPVVMLVLLSATSWWAGAEEAKKPASTGAAVASTPASRSGVLAREDTGVDLVVSKVVLTRGDWAQGKVQIVSYVKNMCSGSTHELIKVSYDDYEMAVWIHGGIGGKQEKSSGAIYHCSTADCAIGPLEVEVDEANVIPEHNETNNTCVNIRLEPGERSKTIGCPIARFDCGRTPPIGKYRSRQTETR
jgi:hypothetical protein